MITLRASSWVPGAWAVGWTPLNPLADRTSYDHARQVVDPGRFSCLRSVVKLRLTGHTGRYPPGLGRPMPPGTLDAAGDVRAARPGLPVRHLSRV